METKSNFQEEMRINLHDRPDHPHLGVHPLSTSSKREKLMHLTFMVRLKDGQEPQEVSEALREQVLALDLIPVARDVLPPYVDIVPLSEWRDDNPLPALSEY
jgi:hypothetical protein